MVRWTGGGGKFTTKAFWGVLEWGGGRHRAGWMGSNRVCAAGSTLSIPKNASQRRRCRGSWRDGAWKRRDCGTGRARAKSRKNTILPQNRLNTRSGACLEAAHAGPAARGGAHGLCGSLCQVVWHSGGGKVAGALTAQAGSTKIRLAGESYEKYRRSSTFGQIFGFFFCRESITFSEEFSHCHCVCVCVYVCVCVCVSGGASAC